MTADAYATAFLILGIEKSMEIINSIRGLDGYLMYIGNQVEYKVTYPKGFEKYLAE